VTQQHELIIVGSGPTSKSGLRSGRDEGVRKVVETAISVDKLQQNFTQFLQNLRQVLTVDEGRVGDLVLDEITFSVEISADGEFKLLGTGIGAAASSSLTFTLRRPRDNS
jgi:hypothetical protein